MIQAKRKLIVEVVGMDPDAVVIETLGAPVLALEIGPLKGALQMPSRTREAPRSSSFVLLSPLSFPQILCVSSRKHTTTTATALTTASLRPRVLEICCVAASCATAPVNYSSSSHFSRNRQNRIPSEFFA